jgi:hypothetical protein
MAKYPTNSEVPRRNPEAVTIRQKTLTSQFDDNGREKRRRKWLYPKRDVSVVHEGLTKAQIATLYDFYMARSGSYEAFSFFLTLSNTYTGEYVGTGDGTTVSFDLPAVNSATYKLYVSAVEQDEDQGIILTESVTQANTTLTMADGSAAADFSDAGVFAAGNYMVVTDSGGREAKGWFGTLAGTEMPVMSARGGATQNWESVDVAFDGDDEDGYTVEVYNFRDYALEAGGGADGADKVTFFVAPNDGSQITYDFTGNLKIRGRFLEDNMTYETFYDRIVNTGLQIRGLLNDE